MRDHERRIGLRRAPRLAVDALLRGRYQFVYDRMPITVSGMNLRKRANLLLSGAHLLRRMVRTPNMPLHMQFEWTSYCNLRCPMCPTGSREMEREKVAMPPELFERIWDETAPYLLTASLWGWGEPLLHPQLSKMLAIAHRHKVATLLSTNGMPLQREAVREALLEHPPMTLIVAIDGITDETNTRYRVGAKLETILDGVRKLVDAKRRRGGDWPVLQLRYIVMRHNEHEVDELDVFARRHGFELLTLRSILPYDVSARNELHGGLIPENEALQPYRERNGRTSGFYCTNPFWFPSLLATGDVVACEEDHSAKAAFGSITDTVGFRQVWFSRRAAEIRRLILHRPEALSFCRSCPTAARPTADASVELRQLVSDHAYPGLIVGQTR